MSLRLYFSLFAGGRTLMAQPFDAASARTTGDAMPVAEQVENSFGVLLNRFSVSQNGVLAYFPSGASGGTQQLAWVDRSGKTAADHIYKIIYKAFAGAVAISRI